MSSERPGQREKINKLVERLVKAGANVEHAKAKARQAAIRDDRKHSNK
jgi:hypothetical protein